MTRSFLPLCAALVAFVGPLVAKDTNNDEAIQKLRLAKFVMPVAPDYVASTGQTEGVVTAAIGRNAEGQVTDVLVLSSTNAPLSRSVVDAVRQWRFALPGNLASGGKEIFPIVRFRFSAKGVAIVSALTGSLAAKNQSVDQDVSVYLPSFADLDAVPNPINHPMPRLTGTAAERAVGGTATVKYFVDQEGKVRVPVVTECSSPELGLAALAAVEQWTFDPPRAGGQPTIALETGQFTFAPPRD